MLNCLVFSGLIVLIGSRQKFAERNNRWCKLSSGFSDNRLYWFDNENLNDQTERAAQLLSVCHASEPIFGQFSIILIKYSTFGLRHRRSNPTNWKLKNFDSTQLNPTRGSTQSMNNFRGKGPPDRMLAKPWRRLFLAAYTLWAKPGCCCCPAWQSVCRVIAALRRRLLYVVYRV